MPGCCGGGGNAFARGQVGLKGGVVRPGRHLDLPQPDGVATGKQECRPGRRQLAGQRLAETTGGAGEQYAGML